MGAGEWVGLWVWVKFGGIRMIGGVWWSELGVRVSEFCGMRFGWNVGARLRGYACEEVDVGTESGVGDWGQRERGSGCSERPWQQSS